MKRIFTCCLLASCLGFTAMAQNPVDQAVSTATKAASQVPGIGSVLTELAKGIDPSAFLPSFKLPSWLSSASKLSPTNASAASTLLSQLGKGINPTSLVQGFSTKDWASQLKSATTISAVATQAETLLNSIKPDAFKSGFDVSTITSMLGALK